MRHSSVSTGWHAPAFLQLNSVFLAFFHDNKLPQNMQEGLLPAPEERMMKMVNPTAVSKGLLC